jgi:signal transduction histidine kinase
MHLTDESSSPFFIFFTFTLIAATLRWNWRGAIWTTLAVLLLWIALSAKGLDSPEFPRIVMRGAFYLVCAGTTAFLGVLLAYFGALRFAKLAAWPAAEIAEGPNPSLEVLLAHAADVMGAPRILVVWEKTEEPERHFSLWREGRLECITGWVDDPIERLVAPCLANAVFATRSAESSLVTTHDGLRLCAAPAVAPRLRTKYNIERVVSAPFFRRGCRGRVFALDCALANSQLPLVEIVADRVSLELEHYFLQQQVQATSAERERSKLAHDLHDGILQNLTAATLQLKVCSRNCDGETRHNLETIQELIMAEQKRLRDFVNGWRRKTDNENFPLASTCERVLAELSTYWRCQTRLRVVPADAQVPSTIAEHLWLILAETIANASKHGNASRVLVDLERTTEALAICISDNGSGFRGLAGSYTDDNLIAEHIGPQFLCDRVRGLQGHLMLSTSPAGSRLQIRLPV